MTSPMDDELVASMEESDRQFMQSSDKAYCWVCLAPVYPQDDWVPYDRQYDFQKGRFTFPNRVAHEQCVQRD